MITTLPPTQAIPEDRLVLPGRIRLSEVIAALSTALDLTEGQPPGHASRSCLIGMRLARRTGLPEAQLAPLFYALLLKDAGCSSNAAKMTWLFGADDRIVKRDLKSVDWTKASNTMRFTLAHVAPAANPVQKALQLATLTREGERTAREMVQTRCDRGAEIARDLGLPETTAVAITGLDEHWNGRGQPDGLQGEEIPLFSRIMGLAQTVEVFHAARGREAALEMAGERRGTWFDPQLVDALLSLKDDRVFWNSMTDPDFEAAVRSVEPQQTEAIADEEMMDRIAVAFATVVDAKSPWTFRHSEGVADIAVGIAEELGYDIAMQRDIRRAGLLHDIGKLGVSNLILDKPGRLTSAELAQMRRHPDLTGQILDRVDAFHLLSDVAAAHHERLDGHGYHRRLAGEELSMEARILAVADVYEALTAQRPYRDGLPLERVDEIMSGDLDTGLCSDCYAALQSWQDRTGLMSRVEAQWESFEALHASF